MKFNNKNIYWQGGGNIITVLNGLCHYLVSGAALQQFEQFYFVREIVFPLLNELRQEKWFLTLL